MTNAPDMPWTTLEPALPSKASRDAFVEHTRALAKVRRDERADEVLDKVRAEFVAEVKASRRADRQALLAAGLVLCDLATQGWLMRVRGERVEIRPPEPVADRVAEKARIRRQELVKRNAQLRQSSVQRFLDSMERQRLHNGAYVSIYSLMRDGRELAEGLREARTHLNNGWADVLSNLVEPYLQFVTEEAATCAYTGLRLMDVWRYFRHTWTNQHTSVPGRTMLFLVRDRAAANHPVMGIGALSSPIMQIRERDSWIGWHPDTFLERVRREPTRDLAKWLVDTLDAAIDEIYVADLLEDKVLSTRDLTAPSDAALDRLLNEGAEQRRLHHRYARTRDLKRSRADLSGDEYWVAQARTHLFRSKRALALATFLRARAVLNEAFQGKPTAEKLAALAATGYGSDAIRRVLKKAKADRVGIAVADISVCGAVQPYNALLGGKLTAMLAASPEVVHQYRRRYAGAESEIASSVAGRPIVRASKLVLLGTTSLYGVGSSQYNRIKIPAHRLGGADKDVIRYEELGRSAAFGTSHYSEETVDALVDLVQQSDAQRVNSIFGEGASPKLRKVRQALELLSLPAGMLLHHHRPRIVYAVSLVRNLADYLIGLARQPDYIIPADAAASTAAIGTWWRERWLRHRITSDQVLEEVARHTRVHPVTHGARVPHQRASTQQPMFTDHS
ncbi:Druantia anti-phage system protein DruA [Myxococcus qinghaiensis]|uniref:Druantia anti-phage system protein DruA n=1 Tax=Myxococcus qinghaiensis TaxID=2906758 RepID=UPI0020A81578|nr:Druantia anti-phage system protein DruA [Myxococcus qinghaiensis]